MKTLFTIGVLIVLAIIANFAAVFVLNIAGLPGALLAGKLEKRSKGQFIYGSVISAIGQSFVYLAYTAFIVNWTMLAISIQGVVLLLGRLPFLRL